MRAWGLIVILAAVLLGASAAARAQEPDYAREQRWAQEITPAILVGEPVYLKLPNGRSFLAIYTKASAKAGASGDTSGRKPAAGAGPAIIVVHGMGVHPDWGLVNTLRSALPDAGYATLSVQMPVLRADARGEDYAATFPEAVQRLRGAAAWLKARGHEPLAIASHSMGARMANEFLTQTPGAGIAAWAAVGMSGAFGAPERLNLPVLDLHGSRDLPAVLEGAPKRAAALRKLPGSTQVQVAGADHFFTDHESELVQSVRRFIDRTLKPR